MILLVGGGVIVFGVLPFLGLGGPVSLPPVLKPVADLGGGEAGGLGQLPFLTRRGVGVMRVPLPQHAPRLLLEAVASFLAVPDGTRQREFSAHPVFAHGTQGSATQLLSFHVMRLQPQLLQLGVVVRRELMALQDLVELPEVASVESDHGLGLEHAFVLVQVVAGRQRPQEPAQALQVPALLQNLAHACHLLLRKAERR